MVILYFQIPYLYNNLKVNIVSSSFKTMISYFGLSMTSFNLMNTNMAEENESRKSDDYTLRVEAQEALKEISFAVSHVELSQVLPQGAEKVYLNVKIQEGDTYCVELSVQGFRVSVAYSVVFPPPSLVWLHLWVDER